MNNSPTKFRAKRWALLALSVAAPGLLALGMSALGAWRTPAARSANPLAQSAADDTPALVERYRHVEAASVSDALEQIYGRRMYMTHRMRPIFPAKFAGLALTVQLKKEEGKQGSAALQGMLEAIDAGAPGSVYVMVVEDGNDIAGMGGLMGTAMAARGFAGAVIDGGVRDTAQLQRISFPVFAAGIVPSTSVNHYRFAGSNVPVVCDGVEVHPQDIVAADNDGVVVVPRAEANAVIDLAEQMDFKEHSMYPVIDHFKSILKAVQQFGRI